MAASGKKNMFNEATRVQMPAMVHLTRLGLMFFLTILASKIKLQSFISLLTALIC